MKEGRLNKAVKVLLLVFLAGMLLVKAKPFLVPLIFAGLLSMLMLPLSMRLERWGFKRGLAELVSILALVSVFAIIISVLAWQVSDLSKNAGNIEQQVTEKVQQARTWLSNTLRISPEKQQEIFKKQQQSSDNKITGFITGALASAGAALTNILLVLVYMFLFMHFRRHLKNFVMKIVEKGQQQNALTVMTDARKVAQKYLTGMALMIVSLWIMYSIGFSIVGVKNAFFFAILCGLLEIIPFVGNLAGNAITVFMTIAQGGSMQMVIGILVVYAVVQFVQSYLIEPLVVGSKVSIHLMFTIIGIIAGEFVWGIPGMILAIPLIGIAKIVCDHVEPLKPYGYLIGEEKTSGGFADKIKKLFKKN